MKKLNEKQVKNIIIASISLVVGILFCFHQALATVLSYIIGCSIIIVGAIFVINAGINKKSILNAEGLIGAIIIALGAYFGGFNLISVVFNFVPFLLMSIGLLITGDSFFRIFKDKKVATFVIQLLIGLAIFALGLCLYLIPEFKKATEIIIGCILIAYAIFLIIYTFVSKKKTTPTKEIKEEK